jgi:hypothetical protein
MRYFDDLVETVSGALAGTPQTFVGTAFEWKVLAAWEVMNGVENMAVDWRGMVRSRLNR